MMAVAIIAGIMIVGALALIWVAIMLIKLYGKSWIYETDQIYGI